MPETPEQDPVESKSLSVPLMVSTLILMLSLVWAIYDEVYALRPWKDYQARFVPLYSSVLENLRPRQAEAEKAVKESPEYQAMQAELKQAEAAANEQIAGIDRQVNRGVTPRMIAARQTFQVLKSEIDALTYQLETASSDSRKASIQSDIDAIKAREVTVDLALADGSGETETVTMTYPAIEAEYLGLQRRRAELQAERVRLAEPANAIRQRRDAYLQDQLFGLTEQQVAGLINRMENFTSDIKQIHLNDIDLVDRCESCHLGIREPVELTREAMGGEAAFTSHPSPDLLQIHNPERFGCTGCHNGNGRATSSVVKGHGRYKHWLWPLYDRENFEAGCQQCHSREVVSEHAPTLNKGRDLFMNKGCWGCHRFEGFDKEADELSLVRQQMAVLRDELAANAKESRRQLQMGDGAADNEAANRHYARTEALQLRNSRIGAELVGGGAVEQPGEWQQRQQEQDRLCRRMEKQRRHAQTRHNPQTTASTRQATRRAIPRRRADRSPGWPASHRPTWCIPGGSLRGSTRRPGGCHRVTRPAPSRRPGRRSGAGPRRPPKTQPRCPGCRPDWRRRRCARRRATRRAGRPPRLQP